MDPQRPFALDNNYTVFSVFFVIRSEKKKWVAWLPMIPFALTTKKNSVAVVKCERALSVENDCRGERNPSKVKMPSEGNSKINVVETEIKQ